MTIDDRYGSSQSQGASQTGTTPGTARSAEYDDGLTVQDTTHGAGPAATDTLGGQGSTAGTTGNHAPAAHRDLGDNHDGAGRDRTDAVTADESGTLIAADKVVGTAVYDTAGERLGTIDSIMLNKRSGKVAYAVMSFGGFLGIGERYHPLPWNVLSYDQGKGGYNIQHTADDLRRAPNYSRSEVDSFDGGSAHSQAVDTYYGVDVGREATTASDSPSTRYGAVGTGIKSGDAVGDTVGAGSSGMLATGMGANRNL